MRRHSLSTFWGNLLRFKGTADWVVLPRVLFFCVWAATFTLIEKLTVESIAIAITPYEIVGAALSLILVLRTNAGYDRWWEARKLWGGIVNQSRSLVMAALTYGPAERRWREDIACWTMAFAHAARCSLRGEKECPHLERLLGPDQSRRVLAAQHMPSHVASMIAERLAFALREGMPGFAFQQADRDRSLLLDHIGGCERIEKTPLPQAYAVFIRRCLVLFLVLVPLPLVAHFGWLTPLITLLVAYPLLSIDEIGDELQRPFSTSSINHLALDDICRTIEQNLTAQLANTPDRSAS